jgi:serine/threonine-protein kinase
VIRESPNPGTSAAKGSTVRLTVSEGPGTKQVPDVTGRGLQQARRILIRAGFQVTEQAAPSATVPADHVVSTNPPALTQLQLGSIVTLNISSGPQQVAVPDVGGKPQDEATSLLQAAGFKVTSTGQESNQPQGTVIAQTPAANANAPMGSTVVLTVAKPFTTVPVPNVVGKNQIDAVNTLSAAGFTPASVPQAVTDPAQNGLVLKQRPTAGHKAKKGAKVTIFVGQQQAPGQTTTPTTPAAP